MDVVGAALRHCPDSELLQRLATHVALDRRLTAEVLALIGEVDARRLYRGQGYASMHLYCIRELHFSESGAFRRITAARLARHFPDILGAIADGRLHLTAVVELAPRLSPSIGSELLAAAEYRTRAEIQQMLAARFPTSESMPLVVEQPPVARPPDARPPAATTGSVGSASDLGREPTPARDQGAGTPVMEPSHQLAPARAPLTGVVSLPSVAPIALERFSLQLSIGNATREKLEHARALLSHALPGGDLSQVLDRALDALIADLEKRKFGATTKPRAPREVASANPRYIPFAVRREVWRRDGGRCTFVGESGQRCEMRRFLEYDHVTPVAHGGLATVDNLRLRCRTHNQFDAEQVLGRALMAQRRSSSVPGQADKGDASVA